MKLIEQCVTMLQRGRDIDLPELFKFIEIVGRVCYKSEDKITENSYQGFINRIISSGHLSVLEHGTVYLCIRGNELSVRKPDVETLLSSPYTFYKVLNGTLYITTNYRVIVENHIEQLYNNYSVVQYDRHIPRITFKFICSRAIANELVRHRVFSFSQESTRYCNYSKDKFDNQLTFIKPYWYTGVNEGGIIANENEGIFNFTLEDSERRYFELLKGGMQPQQARDILPLALKTELVMTGTLPQWQDFIKLRESPNAHPDIQILAKKVKETIYDMFRI